MLDRIGHLEVDSPFGNAGGVIKHPHEVEVMARTGVGWIEAGSYTLEARTGNGPNGEVVYFHDTKTGETFNSLGMPNKGMDVVETEIPEMARIAAAHDKPLIVNIAPVSSEPVRETRELVARAYEAGAHGVLLNGGCPNVVIEDGGRHERLSLDADTLGIVLNGLRETIEKYDRKIFLRLSPTETHEQRQAVVLAIRRSGVVSAVFTPNTWPTINEHIEVPGNVCGKSGPATHEECYKETQAIAEELSHSGIGVVRSGGIVSGSELARSGVLGSGTTFFYESGDWRHDVDRLLREYQEVVSGNL